MGMNGNPPQTPIEKYIIGVLGGFSWGTRPWGSTQRLQRTTAEYHWPAAATLDRGGCGLTAFYLRQSLSFAMQGVAARFATAAVRGAGWPCLPTIGHEPLPGRRRH